MVLPSGSAQIADTTFAPFFTPARKRPSMTAAFPVPQNRAGNMLSVT
jgi:hypothetical protein